MMDVSIRDNADDIHQTLPLLSPNALEAQSRVRAPNAALDEELELGGGFAQKREKENSLPVV
eukprot:1882004-Pyramimonas_sp.AAC.1